MKYLAINSDTDEIVARYKTWKEANEHSTKFPNDRITTDRARYAPLAECTCLSGAMRHEPNCPVKAEWKIATGQ